jgi:GTP 3',8-cyclase
MDQYRIDSHKLIYHPGIVSDWLKGKPIYPIYMEISPSGSCNHRCIYCALDFMEYQPRFLDAVVLKKRLKEMGKLGVKSIMYAGEGEPLLHKDIADIIISTKKSGIDAALTTNGVLFSRELAKATLPYLSWVKVSIDAATPKTYAKIHRTNPQDFNKVLSNMKYAAKIRGTCTLGMQAVLLPNNYKEISLLAEKAKAIGMDYLVVKPYSQHPLSKTKTFKDIKYGHLNLKPKRNVIFRTNAMEKWDKANRGYKQCLALPFWAYIDAGGNVWSCSMYLNNEKFRLGNIYRDNFKDIGHNNKVVRADKCRINCRMDEINRYLWELKHPGKHVNFP